MSIKGSPYARFRRALDTRNLTLIRAAATELPTVNLKDALEILPVIAKTEPERYERAACRWLARLALERDVNLEAVSAAVDALNRLPTTDEPSPLLRQLAAG